MSIKLAVFDFDGTLFLKDTLPYLLSLWRRFKYPKKRLLSVALSISGLYLGYKLSFRGRKDREKVILSVMQVFTALFKGLTKEQVEGFLDRCAPVIIKQLNKAVVGEAVNAKAEGYRTVLLSGCYSYLLNLIGKPLLMDDVIGTELIYKDGVVDLEKPLLVVYGPEKVTSIKSFFEGRDVDWYESTAYADSNSDLPLLNLVGRPVAVDPDSELRKTAESMRWRIMDLSGK